MSGPLPGLPDSHMTSHDWIYENIVEAGVRFGYVPTVVKPVAGAAGHIGWHNAAVVDLLALADLAGQSYVTPLPAEAEAGNSGHEQDHVYLQEASDETLEWDTFNKASGGTESDIVIDGQTWRLHEFTSNGTFVVTMSAQPFVVCMTGGGTGANYYVGTYAYGSQVLPSTDNTEQQINLENKSYQIVIGAGGSGGQNNNTKGGVTTAFGYSMQPDRTDDPVTNNIAGTPDPPNTGLFGGAGNKPTSPVHYGQGGVGAANRGTDGQPGYCGIRYKIA